MSLAIIIKKEVKELMTPQTILPVVVMSIMFGALGTMMGGVEEEVSTPPVVGLVDEDGTVLSGIAVAVFSQHAELVYNGSSAKDGLSVVEEKDGIALVVVPRGFEEAIMNNTTGVFRIKWLMKGAGLLDGISTSVVENIIWNVDRAISAYLVTQSSDLNASVVLHPTGRNETTVFKGKELEGMSPGSLTNALSAQSFMVPLLIMMIIMMAGQTVISSMALEKENKTLETLLTMPVKRTSIVTGKIVGSAIAGLVMASIFMVGFYFYSAGFSFGDDVSTDLDLSLTVLDFALVLLSMFTALLAGLAIAMILGTFAKNFKSGQALTFPLVAMALVPMFLTMFKDFDTLPLALKALVFAIPFSHPMMAMRSLMFGDYLLVIGGILYSVAFSVVVILIVVRIFSTDKLLTGKITSTEKTPKGIAKLMKALGR